MILRHPYFDDIRDYNKEVTLDYKLHFDFEYVRNITSFQLREYFAQEILWYNS